jgi:general secretion pathway protein B
MSYILDALRRADAERDGASIHGGFGQAQLHDADESEPASPASPWVWMAAGMLLVILAGVFWRWVVMDTPAAPAASAMPAAQVAQAAPPPVVAPAAVAAAPVPAPAAEPAPLTPPEQAVSRERPQGQALPGAPSVGVEEPRGGPAFPHEPKASARKAANPPAGNRPAEPAPRSERPPAVEPRIYQLNELPDDIRRQLPQLTVGGAMYFEKPSERMVILNGQLFHEGDALTPNLWVRQIKLKSTELEYRGFRYELNY